MVLLIGFEEVVDMDELQTIHASDKYKQMVLYYYDEDTNIPKANHPNLKCRKIK